MSDSIYIQLSDPWRQGVTITPKIARQIVAMGQPTNLEPVAPMSFANYSIKGWTDKPAAPANDEATIDAVVAAYNKRADELEVAWCNMDCMQSVLAVIRQGEVPGLPSPDEFAKVKAERDAANARAEKAEEELERQVMTHQTDMEAMSADRQAARSAHAEAMALLNEVMAFGIYVKIGMKIDAHRQKYAKHQNKDASK